MGTPARAGDGVVKEQEDHRSDDGYNQVPHGASVILHTDHAQNEPAKDSADAKLIASNTKVSVSVDKDNKIYLNGQEIGVLQLADKVAQELADKPPDERVVLLKIHKETLAATFNPIMEAVSLSGGEVLHVIDEEMK